jgi:glyoxylase-like metal-dependent hydrolase (beta-lactamase superfamily II)/rhodanese-related sulfurtransferase
MGTTDWSVIGFVDEGLGHSSYLVEFGDGRGLVVDPPRIPTELLATARERDLAIGFTADTHSHADYVSGSPMLASQGAEFLASRGADLDLPHHPIAAGDEIALNEHLQLRAIATPGHTPDHLAYLLVDDGRPAALFSGGSLMVGTVGRTDLLGDDRREDLARRLYRALEENVLTLPDDVAVYPTHGAGSFCSAPSSADRTTTIGRERATNPLLQLHDEDRFVTTLLDGLGSFPTYFRRLPEINRRGPRIYDAVPELARLTVDRARDEIARGALVIDVRPIAEYAAGHVPGALSIELRPVFGSWLGWLVPPDTPLVFVVGERQDRADLVRQCLDVGAETLVGQIDGGVVAWRGAGHPVATTRLVDATAMRGPVLDVRQADEYRAGHIPGARHVELGALADADVTSPVTVMCGHGERAMTGASVLERNGLTDVAVLAGGPDDWSRAHGTSLVTGR